MEDRISTMESLINGVLLYSRIGRNQSMADTNLKQDASFELLAKRSLVPSSHISNLVCTELTAKALSPTER